MSARSPSGLTGSCWLLATGGPQLRTGLGFFLLWGPELLAGVRELDRDALHLGRDPVERVAKTEVRAERFVPPRFAYLRDQGISVLAELLGLLADQCVDLLVGRLQAEPIRRGLEHDLTLEGLARLGLDVGLDLLRRAAAELDVDVGADATSLE